jgi:hypothetical protein
VWKYLASDIVIIGGNIKDSTNCVGLETKQTKTKAVKTRWMCEDFCLDVSKHRCEQCGEHPSQHFAGRIGARDPIGQRQLTDFGLIAQEPMERIELGLP